MLQNVLEILDRISTTDENLTDNIASLRQYLDGRLPSTIIHDSFSKNSVPVDGCYLLNDFLHTLACRRGQTYGWRIDYIKASETSPGCRSVKSDDIQKWQKTQLVPVWAYDQIAKLVFPKRKGENGPDWTPEEFDHMIELYLDSIKNGGKPISNAKLAEQCSNKFGRKITENSIKGAIDRQRKKGRLPLFRKSSKSELALAA